MVTTIQTLQGTGVVKIESNPPGGDVYIDEEYYGKSPVTVKDVVVGRHVYVIKYPGQPDHHGAMNVVAGEVCYARYNFYNYGLEESCPPIQLASGATSLASGTIADINKLTTSVQTLQAPAPIPGYIIISQNTVIWTLITTLAGILLYDHFKKKQ